MITITVLHLESINLNYSIYKNRKSKEYILYPDFLDLSISKRRSIRAKQKIFYNSHLAKKFITLTYNDEHLNSAYKNDINLFIKRLKYELTIKRDNIRYYNSETLEYLWKFETNSIGKREYNPHFHVITNIESYIEQKTLESIWGNGFIDVQQIKSKKDLMIYVSKYMSKDTTLMLKGSKAKDWTQCEGCVSCLFDYQETKTVISCMNDIIPDECMIQRQKSFSSSRGYKKPKSEFMFKGTFPEEQAYAIVLEMNRKNGIGGLDPYI